MECPYDSNASQKSLRRPTIPERCARNVPNRGGLVVNVTDSRWSDLGHRHVQLEQATVVEGEKAHQRHAFRSRGVYTESEASAEVFVDGEILFEYCSPFESVDDTFDAGQLLFEIGSIVQMTVAALNEVITVRAMAPDLSSS